VADETPKHPRLLRPTTVTLGPDQHEDLRLIAERRFSSVSQGARLFGATTRASICSPGTCAAGAALGPSASSVVRTGGTASSSTAVSRT
jgi:hypothetical protein